MFREEGEDEFHNDDFLSCEDWDFDIVFEIEDEVLHITATNKYDAEVKFSHKFTEDCLRKMGLTNKDSMNKIERLLSQARDGDSEDSSLLFFIPGHNLAPAFDTSGEFADTMIIRLEWNSLIGELNFEFPLTKCVCEEDKNPHSMKHDILVDRVKFLEHEVSYLKTELENNRNEVARLRNIVENMQDRSESRSIVYEGENDNRFVRVERRRRDKRKNRRRGAVQLDSFGELDFGSFSSRDYDYFFSDRRRVRDKNRRQKNNSWNSLPPSFCHHYGSNDV